MARYMTHRRRPPSPTWRTFLANHASQIVAADFFVVPTVTYRLLFVLILLSHERRRLVHVAVTRHPTAAWTAQQLREAFPNDDGPRFLLHDRDTAFAAVVGTVGRLGARDISTAPRSPWQNGFAERVIGSIQRECLDHVIVFNESGLRRILRQYVDYYHRSRTHLGLEKDTPVSRPVSTTGRIVVIPQVGRLHHRLRPPGGVARRRPTRSLRRSRPVSLATPPAGTAPRTRRKRPPPIRSRRAGMAPSIPLRGDTPLAHRPFRNETAPLKRMRAGRDRVLSRDRTGRG